MNNQATPSTRFQKFRLVFAMTLAAYAVLVFSPIASAQQIQVESGNPTVVFAGEELQSYLSKMNVSVGDARFFLGDVQQNQTLLKAIQHSPKNTDETFAIYTNKTERTIHLVGATPRATLYAVYGFLEQQGCRFFAPGRLGEVVPKRKNLIWSDKKIIESPKMHTREIGGAAPPNVTAEAAVDWRVKNRLNRAFALRPERFPVGSVRTEMRRVWKKRGQFRRWQWIAHNFPFIFPETEKWFERHPEYFAMYQGRRRRPGSSSRSYYGGGNLAFTNPDVIQHTAKFAKSWFKRFPEGEVVPVWPNDGAIYWDESPEAMKLGGKNFMAGPEGSMTGRMVHFANSVARQISKDTRKDQLILLPAYANYIEPIKNQKIEPNVLVQYCYHGDYAHGPEQAKHNLASAKQMRTWAAQAKHFGVWEYFLIGDFHQTEPAPVLLPLVYRIRDTMKFLHEIDCKHYFTQSTPAYQTYNPLVYYALARYTWNPELDADELIADYCQHSFGNQAGIPMTKFYQSMEQACQKSSWSPTTYGEVVSPSPAVFSKKLLEKLQNLLDKAAGCELSEDQNARLKAVQDALAATRGAVKVASVVDLSGKGSWRMLRTDDAYIINPDGPVVEKRRFDALVQHAVDTGGGGPTLKRTAFRARRRSEPLTKLHTKNLSLAVVPGIGGRAVRLVDRDQNWNFFHEGASSQKEDSVSKAYLEYGGYETYVGRQFAAPGWEQPYTIVNRSQNSLHLKADSEEWSLQRKFTVSDSPKKLTIKDTLTQTAMEPAKRALRSHPQLTLGGNPREILLFRRTNNQQWKKVDILKNLHDQIFPGFSGKPTGGQAVDEIAVWQPATNRGLVIRAISDSAEFMPELYIFADKGKKHFQIERLGIEKTLKANESISLQQEFIPFSAPKMAGLEKWISIQQKQTQPQKIQVTGKVKQWIKRGTDKGNAAEFDSNHRLTFSNHHLSAKTGTIAAWVRVPAASKKPHFILSSGNNRDSWLAITVSADSASWLSKLGKAPYSGPGEAYSSLAAKWADAKDPNATSKDSLQKWHHVAYSWKLSDDKKSCELVIRIDGRVVQKRSNLTWIGGMPRSPVIVGGNSASKRTAGPVAIDDLIYLDHSIASEDEAKKIMQSPLEAEGLKWYFSFDKTIQPSDGKSSIKK